MVQTFIRQGAGESLPQSSALPSPYSAPPMYYTPVFDRRQQVQSKASYIPFERRVNDTGVVTEIRRGIYESYYNPRANISSRMNVYVQEVRTYNPATGETVVEKWGTVGGGKKRRIKYEGKDVYVGEQLIFSKEGSYEKTRTREKLREMKEWTAQSGISEAARAERVEKYVQASRQFRQRYGISMPTAGGQPRVTDIRKAEQVFVDGKAVPLHPQIERAITTGYLQRQQKQYASKQEFEKAVKAYAEERKKYDIEYINFLQAARRDPRNLGFLFLRRDGRRGVPTSVRNWLDTEEFFAQMKFAGLFPSAGAVLTQTEFAKKKVAESRIVGNAFAEPPRVLSPTTPLTRTVTTTRTTTGTTIPTFPEQYPPQSAHLRELKKYFKIIAPELLDVFVVRPLMGVGQVAKTALYPAYDLTKQAFIRTGSMEAALELERKILPSIEGVRIVRARYGETVPPQFMKPSQLAKDAFKDPKNVRELAEDPDVQLAAFFAAVGGLGLLAGAGVVPAIQSLRLLRGYFTIRGTGKVIEFYINPKAETLVEGTIYLTPEGLRLAGGKDVSGILGILRKAGKQAERDLVKFDTYAEEKKGIFKRGWYPEIDKVEVPPRIASQYYSVTTPFNFVTVFRSTTPKGGYFAIDFDKGFRFSTRRVGRKYFIRETTTPEGETITKVFKNDKLLKQWKSKDEPPIRFTEQVGLLKTKELLRKPELTAEEVKIRRKALGVPVEKVKFRAAYETFQTDKLVAVTKKLRSKILFKIRNSFREEPSGEIIRVLEPNILLLELLKSRYVFVKYPAKIKTFKLYADEGKFVLERPPVSVVKQETKLGGRGYFVGTKYRVAIVRDSRLLFVIRKMFKSKKAMSLVLDLNKVSDLREIGKIRVERPKSEVKYPTEFRLSASEVEIASEIVFVPEIASEIVFVPEAPKFEYKFPIKLKPSLKPSLWFRLFFEKTPLLSNKLLVFSEMRSKQFEKQFQEQKQFQKQFQEQKQFQKQFQEQKQFQKQFQEQKQFQKQFQEQKQFQKQFQLQKQITIQRQIFTALVPQLMPPPPPPPLPPPPETPESYVRGKRKRYFDVFVRAKAEKKGKKRTLGSLLRASKGGLTKREALSLGSFIVDRSTARTFMIKPSPNKARRANLFRYSNYWRTGSRKFRKPIHKRKSVSSSPLWIEKTKFLIDTRGEKQQLAAARLIAKMKRSQRYTTRRRQRKKMPRKKPTRNYFLRKVPGSRRKVRVRKH